MILVLAYILCISILTQSPLYTVQARPFLFAHPPYEGWDRTKALHHPGPIFGKGMPDSYSWDDSYDVDLHTEQHRLVQICCTTNAKGNHIMAMTFKYINICPNSKSHGNTYTKLHSANDLDIIKNKEKCTPSFDYIKGMKADMGEKGRLKGVFFYTKAEEDERLRNTAYVPKSFYCGHEPPARLVGPEHEWHAAEDHVALYSVGYVSRNGIDAIGFHIGKRYYGVAMPPPGQKPTGRQCPRPGH